jgi:hypothetical protein
MSDIFWEYLIHGKGPFKMDEKVSEQPRGPAVNGATLALFCGITNRAMRSHYGFKKTSLAL